METSRGRLTDNEPIIKQFNGAKGGLSWSITPTKIIQENHDKEVERAIPLDKIQFYRESTVSTSASMAADFGTIIGIILILAGVIFGVPALSTGNTMMAIAFFGVVALGLGLIVLSRKIAKKKQRLSPEEENMRFLNIQTEVGGVGIYLNKSDIPQVLNTINKAMDENTMDER